MGTGSYVVEVGYAFLVQCSCYFGNSLLGYCFALNPTHILVALKCNFLSLFLKKNKKKTPFARNFPTKGALYYNLFISYKPLMSFTMYN